MHFVGVFYTTIYTTIYTKMSSNLQIKMGPIGSKSVPQGLFPLTTFKRMAKGAVVVLVDFAFEDRGFYYWLSGFWRGEYRLGQFNGSRCWCRSVGSSRSSFSNLSSIFRRCRGSGSGFWFFLSILNLSAFICVDLRCRTTV